MAALLAAAAALASTPMNGDAPGGLYFRSATEKGAGTMEPVPHDIAHPGSYFEAYSPNISTVYSEVFWHMMDEVPLDPAFVARFKGKTIAVTGYECDSTRMLPGGGEEHVPISDQYNHHHAAWVIGANARMVDLGPAGQAGTHGNGRWEVRDRPLTSAEKEAQAQAPPKAKVPTSVYLVDGNGGEYRMSLHGTHRGTAMLLESPTSFRITPMMINTKPPAGKKPGEWDLLPSGAYGRSRGATPPPGNKSLYSPMLECPCTDRKPKVITQHNTVESGTCAAKLATATECFGAITALGLLPMTGNSTISSKTVPSSCYATSTKDGYEAVFNSANSTAACGSGDAPSAVRSTGSHSSAGVNVALALDESVGNCTAATSDVAGRWECSWGCTALGAAGTPYPIDIHAVAGKPGSYTFSEGPGRTAGAFRMVGNTAMVSSPKGWPNANVSVDWTTWSFANGVVWKRPAKSCTGEATITLSGPAVNWFGTGFDARSMADAYAVIVDGQGKVTERQLGNGQGIAGRHQPGLLLAPSVKVVTNTVANGVRTVVMTRPLVGLTAKHATFTATADGVPIIAAVGSSPTLSFHKARTADDLMLVRVGAPMCVCQGFGHASGSIGGVPFGNHCPPALANDHQGKAAGNDVCDVTTYEGGLKCCAHGSILLDAAQTPPPEKDTYRMKFRVYYEEYTNQSEAFFMFQAIDAGGEYDVPQALAGTPPQERVHTVAQDFTVASTLGGAHPPTPTTDVLLLRAGTHCHAPACINETLTNLDTGELICYNAPLYGKGEVGPKSGQSFDEPEYAAGIPPCYWGDAAEGLPPPPQLKLGTRLRSVKNCNSTYYHFGVMAQWQMRGTWAN